MALYVEETGTKGAPSIIFLHGVGASGWMWWQQTAALRDYHCLNVDLPGHGESHQMPWLSLADTTQQDKARLTGLPLLVRSHRGIKLFCVEFAKPHRKADVRQNTLDLLRQHLREGMPFVNAAHRHKVNLNAVPLVERRVRSHGHGIQADRAPPAPQWRQGR